MSDHTHTYISSSASIFIARLSVANAAIADLFPNFSIQSVLIVLLYSTSSNTLLRFNKKLCKCTHLFLCMFVWIIFLTSWSLICCCGEIFVNWNVFYKSVIPLQPFLNAFTIWSRWHYSSASALDFCSTLGDDDSTSCCCFLLTGSIILLQCICGCERCGMLFFFYLWMFCGPLCGIFLRLRLIDQDGR